MTDYSELKRLAQAATPGPWSVPHLSRDELTCDCAYVFADEYLGGIAEVYVDNGLALQHGGNDCPPREIAKANGRFIAAANPSAILALIAENERQARKIDHSEYWYGARFETLFHWAHKELSESQKNQYFNIVANGTAGPNDPPTYAQQMNRLKWKVEAAEKERDMLKSELQDFKQGAKVEADAGDEARAEVVKLKAENEALHSQVTVLQSDANSWQSGYEEGRRMAGMDAKRYRWLRERDLETIHQGGVFAGLTPRNVVLNGEDLDEAVDAAMFKAVSQ